MIWMKRVVTVLILGFSFIGMVKKYHKFFSISYGSGMAVGFVFFVLCDFVIGALFSTAPAFVPQLYYPFFVLTLLFVSDQADSELLLKTVGVCLGVVIVLSLLMMAVPSWGFAKNSKSLIPGIPGRLVGLSSHPNSIGPLAFLYVLILFASPLKNKFSQYLLIMAAGGVVFLSQSKTVWFATVLSALFVIVYQYFSIPRVRGARRFEWVVIGGVFGLGFGGLVLLLMINVFPGAFRFGSSGDQVVANLGTFMGRTEIWKITLDFWAENPLFGYGPKIWSPEFRIQQGLLYVGQAHNQFVQTLGDSGLIGILGLVVYLFSIVLSAFKLRRVSCGISIAVAILFISRCITETPVRSMGVSDSTFFAHFLTVFLLLLWYRRNANSFERLEAR